MDHSRDPRLDAVELNEENLVDVAVYGPDEKRIGTITHIRGNSGNAQVVVDIGGFLGIGARAVMLDMGRLDVMRDESGVVHATVYMNMDELKALPESRD